MVSNDTFFQGLTEEQKEVVRDSFGTRKHMCSGCASYLGKTEVGEFTYFWHYGQSEGYVSLPVADENPHYDYDSGNISIAGQTFTTEGVEILPPPFQYLIHVDLRLFDTHYKEVGSGFTPEEADSYFICCGGGSYLPERAALSAGVEPKVGISWVANYWLSPWELTEELTRSALAITMVYPDGRRIIVL